MSPELSDFLSQVCTGLGVSLAAADIDRFFQSRPTPTAQELESFLKLHGVQAYAPQVIKAFVERGYLTVDASRLHGEHGVSVAVGALGTFAAQNSTFQTGAGSSVHMPVDGSIQGGHSSGLHLDDHGNVIFEVGGGGIKVNVGSENVRINVGRKR